MNILIFEDAGEVLKVLSGWLLMSAILPLYSLVTENHGILLEMVRTREGWAYFGTCLLMSLVLRVWINALLQRSSKG